MLSQEEIERIAQTTANLVINEWLPRYKKWKKENAQRERDSRTLSEDGGSD